MRPMSITTPMPAEVLRALHRRKYGNSLELLTKKQEMYLMYELSNPRYSGKGFAWYTDYLISNPKKL